MVLTILMPETVVYCKAASFSGRSVELSVELSVSPMDQSSKLLYLGADCLGVRSLEYVPRGVLVALAILEGEKLHVQEGRVS